MKQNKQNKQNNTMKKNRTLNFSDGTFTIDELTDINPQFIPITLRSRLTKCITNRSVIKIGSLHQPLGRPKLLFTQSPLTDTDILEAKDRDVVFEDNLKLQVTQTFQKHNIKDSSYTYDMNYVTEDDMIDVTY
jgi:hypothetical protein